MISSFSQKLNSELNSCRHIEVTKASPCVHCGKPDWCYRLGDNISVCKREVKPADGWYATKGKDKEGAVLYATIESKEAWKAEQKKGGDKGEIVSKASYHYDLIKFSTTESLFHLHNGTATLSDERVIVYRQNYQNGSKKIFQASKTSWDETPQWNVPPDWRERILPYGLMKAFGSHNIWQEIPTEPLSSIKRTVFIPEGEKCVDVLRNKGAIAICNYNGGGRDKWKESDTGYFIDLYRWYNGKERENWQSIVPTVVLCPDRDKVGLEHCVEIFKSLVTAGYPEDKIKWYFCYSDWDRIPPSSGLDIADMFDENPDLTAEDILKDIKTTEECHWLERYFRIDSSEENDDGDDDLICCIDGLENISTEIEWTIEDVLPTGYAIVLTGKPGCGKSLSLFDMAAAIAGGGTWNGKQCKQGKVLILNNDQPEDVLKRTLKIRLGEDMELRSQVFFKHGWTADEEGLKKLRKWVKKHDFALVIMDSVRECICTPLGLSENSPETGHKLKEVSRIVTDNRTCFIAIHHDKKGEASGVDKAAGHNSLLSPIDAHWRITRGQTGCFLSMTKTRGYSPIELSYQIDFNTGICHPVEASEVSATSNGNNPTIGERVVAYLSDQASLDGASRKELAEALGVKDTSLKEILRRLVSEGQIESVTNPENSRQRLYRLTDEEE